MCVGGGRRDAMSAPAAGVEEPGLEPGASCVQNRRSCHLSYIPAEGCGCPPWWGVRGASRTRTGGLLLAKQALLPSEL